MGVEKIISAVLTIVIILVVARIFLYRANTRSGIQKPDHMSDSEYERKINKKK